MNSIRRFLLTGFTVALAFLPQPKAADPMIQIVPSTFDFGWSPDNAMISCEFQVKNLGAEMIPITSVQPGCGCTATDFTPEGLPASEVTMINLTFNTRGYAHQIVNRPVKVKAGMPEQEYTVYIRGAVIDQNATVAPEGTGIAEFNAEGPSKTTLSIKNNSAKALALKLIQKPSAWATIKTPRAGLPANESASVEIKVSGDVKETRATSATFEASDGTETHRFTLAIRTGQAPPAMRRIKAAPKASPKPTPTPAP